jgi:hypothetical protein
MIKDIFKAAWDKYMLHLGSLVVVTILMFITYLILLKLTLFGGELLRPFFLYGMFNVLLNHSDFQIGDVEVITNDDLDTKNFVKSVHKRPEKIDIKYFLTGFGDKNTAFKILVYGFLKTIFLAIGLAFFIIPGIYFECATIFALPLILKKDIGVIDAFKKSIEMFNKNFIELLLVILILIVINAATAFPYGLFSIFTVPFSIAVIAAAYEKLFN